MAAADDEKDSDIDTNPLCLDETELKCLASQAELPESNSGYINIYRHATTADVVVMSLSAAAAIGAGAALPLMMVSLRLYSPQPQKLTGPACNRVACRKICQFF